MDALLCGSRKSVGRTVMGAKVRRSEGEEDGVTNNVDILNEIFKHLDAASLGKAACVNSKWRRATDEEALWEAICTRHWPGAAAASASGQLKSVVVALGGFKRLYVNCVHPLLCRSKDTVSRGSKKRWSNDEVYLSLSLFSIDCYERIRPKTSSSLASSLCKPSFNSDVRRLLDGWKGKCDDQVDNSSNNR